MIRAEILRRRNMFDQAIADATCALTIDPRNAAAFSVRAECRNAIGDREGAREDVQEMLLIDPTRPVPALEVRRAPSPSEVVGDDDRFRKRAGDHGRDDERALFADGKPVDKTYRSRQVVSDEEAPEVLGVASGYKPQTIARPIPRARTNRKAPQVSPILIGVVCLGLLGGGYALINQGRDHQDANRPGGRTKPSETSPAEKAIPEQVVHVPHARASVSGSNEADPSAPLVVEGKTNTPAKVAPARGSGKPRREPPIGKPPQGSGSRTAAYRIIEVAIDRDGSGTILTDSRRADEIDGGNSEEPGAAVSGLDGLKNAVVSRLKDGRFRIVHDFREIRDIGDLKSPFTSIDPAQHQIDTEGGVVVLTPVTQQGYKLARLMYPRQLRLPGCHPGKLKGVGQCLELQ